MGLSRLLHPQVKNDWKGRATSRIRTPVLSTATASIPSSKSATTSNGAAAPTKGTTSNPNLQGARMEIGVDSFAAILPDPATGRIPSASERMADLLGEIEVADQVGINVFGIGEHHRAEFLDSAPAVILAAAAARTQQIRLTSAVTVLSAADPVRVFQEFATLDLISQGRAEMVVGRGSSIEAFPLFGFDLDDYDALFKEKLGLLLEVRANERVRWSGRFRPA